MDGQKERSGNRTGYDRRQIIHAKHTTLIALVRLENFFPILLEDHTVFHDEVDCF